MLSTYFMYIRTHIHTHVHMYSTSIYLLSTHLLRHHNDTSVALHCSSQCQSNAYTTGNCIQMYLHDDMHALCGNIKKPRSFKCHFLNIYVCTYLGYVDKYIHTYIHTCVCTYISITLCTVDKCDQA